MPRKKTPDYGKQVTFRASKATLKQLDDLAREWGENNSRVVVRAIANAHFALLAQREQRKEWS